MQAGGTARRMALRLLFASAHAGASGTADAAATPVEISYWTLRLMPATSIRTQQLVFFSFR